MYQEDQDNQVNNLELFSLAVFFSLEIDNFDLLWYMWSTGLAEVEIAIWVNLKISCYGPNVFLFGTFKEIMHGYGENHLGIWMQQFKLLLIHRVHYKNEMP